MHRFVPVRFSSPVRAVAALLPGGLSDKLRWSPDRRTLYVPLPVPRIDPPLASDPVVRVVGAESALTVKVAMARSERSKGSLRWWRWTRPRRPWRLIQNAGSFVNSRGEGGDVGAGEEDANGRYDREEIVPALCGAALWARRDALDAAGCFPSTTPTITRTWTSACACGARGGLLIFCPSSRVDHYHTGNQPREFAALHRKRGAQLAAFS